MIKKIDHFVITTDHLEACLAFYEVLGFVVEDCGGAYALHSGDFKINVHIHHQEREPKAKYVTCGSADVCFVVDDNLEFLYKQCLKQGVNLISKIVVRTGSQGIMHSFYLRDPDGNLIELCSYQ